MYGWPMRTAKAVDGAPQSTGPGLRLGRIGNVLIVIICACAVAAGAYAHFRTSTKAVPSQGTTTAPVHTSTAPSGSRVSQNQPKPLGIPGKWKLILNSDFGDSFDTSVWRPGWFGTGVTGPVNSNEIACYSSKNVTFPGDGAVQLAVTATPSRCGGKTQPYTGAVLTTNPDDGRLGAGFAYRYGVMEARIYVPGSDGMIANWPTVMTLGQVWPKQGEDDIFEGLSGTDCLHFHSPGYAPGGDLGGCDPGVTPGWHTIAANWEAGSVTWYYDGTEIEQITQGVTSSPMYMVLLYTVSSKGRNVANADAMRVSYVRVWKPTKGSRK